MIGFIEKGIGEHPLILMLASFLILALPVVKFLHSYFHLNKKMRVSSLELLLKVDETGDFLSKKLLVEQAFLNIFKFRIKYDVISELLKSSSPTEMIGLYRKSDVFLKYENQRLVFIDKYKDYRVRRKFRYLRPFLSKVLYFVLSYFGTILLIFLYKYLQDYSYVDFSELVITVCFSLVVSLVGIAMVVAAFIALLDEKGIVHAEKLCDALYAKENFLKHV
jgi:hypothetical protein